MNDSVVCRCLNNAFQKSPVNLLSRSLTMFLGMPQPHMYHMRMVACAQFSAVKVVLPGMRSVSLENLHVQVIMESACVCPGNA